MRTFMMLVCLIVGSITMAPAIASSAWVHVNGSSYHFAEAGHGYNEDNRGVGASWNFKHSGNTVTYNTADVFIDSLGEPSGYIGKAWEYRVGAVGMGAMAFLMYRDNFDYIKTMPGVLPMMTFGTNKVRTRVTFIPDMGGDLDVPTLAWQFMFRY
ncbi:hypothetical protein [Thioalkalivibrio thiocyanodenitrificans]|uniref:hypothetical protein n=1 Tax=Thioalkalivibrio thiocyanodenitrificans TaxID=243063 RepID=UPI0003739B1E|nr:hypothetical protein [Thioalkalivibrio thiocyanodenitrificans]